MKNLRYLITIVSGLVLWLLIVPVFNLPTIISEYFEVTFEMIEVWMLNYKIISGIAALGGILLTCFWYLYGNRDKIAGQVKKNRKVWVTFFIISLTLAAGLVVYINAFYYFSDYFQPDYDDFGVLNVVFPAILISLQTWIFLWVNAYFLSPVNVIYVVFGKK